MAWELSVVHPNGHRLGRPKEVMAAISRALPDLQWVELPPLLEEIKDQPDHPLHQILPMWTAEQRRRAALPRTVGTLEGEGFAFEVYGFEDDPVEDFYLDVSGDGEPTPTLMKLKTGTRWAIKELAIDRFLDEAQMRERWATFLERRRLTE